MKKYEKELIKMYAFYKEFNELVNSSLNICMDLNAILDGAGVALVDTFLAGLVRQLPRDIRLLRKYRKSFPVPDDEPDGFIDEEPPKKPPETLPKVAEETRVVVCEVKDSEQPSASATEE